MRNRLLLFILPGILLLTACAGNGEEANSPTEYHDVSADSGNNGAIMPVAARLTATVSPTKTMAADEESDIVGAGVIVGGEAVVFAEPATDATEIGILEMDTEVEILDQTEPDRIGIIFYQVRYESMTGWVASTRLQVLEGTAIETVASPPPTFTPSATPTIPTATPTITPTVLPAGFPTPERYSVTVAEQPFERGRMLWIEPIRQIWVLVGDEIDPTQGTWYCYVDAFQEGQRERDPALDPPEGVTTASNFRAATPMQPVRGFGKIWRDNPEIRDALGWSLVPETLYNTRYLHNAGGTMESGTYQAAPGSYVVMSFFQHDLIFYEDEIGAPCNGEQMGTWELQGTFWKKEE